MDKDLPWSARWVVLLPCIALALTTPASGQECGDRCTEVEANSKEFGFSRNGEVCVELLRPECRELKIEPALERLITTSLRFGGDQVLERFESLRRERARRDAGALPAPGQA